MNPIRTALFISLLAFGPAVAAQENVSKVNGSISADAGSTYGDLDTVNGSIRIGEGAVVADADTVNGSITVGDRARTGSLETVNGSIRIGQSVQIGGGVDTVNGAIFVDRGSTISGDVETVNGSIGLVATQVSGDVETVRGNITVGVDSHVSGGVRVQKSTGFFNNDRKKPARIVIGPNAVVEGSLVFERPVVLYVHDSARIGTVTGATPIAFSSPTAPNSEE